MHIPKILKAAKTANASLDIHECPTSFKLIQGRDLHPPDRTGTASIGIAMFINWPKSDMLNQIFRVDPTNAFVVTIPNCIKQVLGLLNLPRQVNCSR